MLTIRKNWTKGEESEWKQEDGSPFVHNMFCILAKTKSQIFQRNYANRKVRV